MTLLYNLPLPSFIFITHPIPSCHELRAIVIMSIFSTPFLLHVRKTLLGVNANPVPIRVLRPVGIVSMLLRSVDYYSSIPPFLHYPILPLHSHTFNSTPSLSYGRTLFSLVGRSCFLVSYSHRRPPPHA